MYVITVVLDTVFEQLYTSAISLMSSNTPLHIWYITSVYHVPIKSDAINAVFITHIAQFANKLFAINILINYPDENQDFGKNHIPVQVFLKNVPHHVTDRHYFEGGNNCASKDF